MGYEAGKAITTGANNTILGAYTGSAAPISATGSNWIILSDGAGNVRGAFDSSGNLLVGTTSATTPATTSSLSIANTFGFKNRIINGAMVIDQRNAGAAVTRSGTSNSYLVDRWLGNVSNDGTITLQQVVDAPATFVNSLKITVTVADSSLSALQYALIRQSIEGYNVSDFAFGSASAQTITLSFWVKSSVTGTFGGCLRNSAANRSYPFSYSISSANTWEQKTITIAGDTSGTWLTTNGVGFDLDLTVASGTTYAGTAGSWSGGTYITATGTTNLMATLNATWQVTGVQLEKGSTATSFDYRPYTTELQLCQRYYWKSLGAGNESIGVAGYNVASNAVWSQFGFPVTMRATPTVTVNGTWGVSNTGQPTIRAASATNFLLQAVATGTAALATYPNTSDDFLDANAEL
jgi:hypothetical protein